MSELEQRGFAKKLNGKGTIVIEPDDTKLHQLAFNSGYVEKALRYLHALQLMVLIMRPAALVAAPQFTREELDELADRFTSSDSIYLMSTEQIPIFAAAIKSAKSAQTGAKGYAGFYADSTLQSTWQA